MISAVINIIFLVGIVYYIQDNSNRIEELESKIESLEEARG